MIFNVYSILSDKLHDKKVQTKKDKPEKNSKNVDEGTVKLEPGLKL